MTRLLCILILIAGPALALHAAASLVISITNTWNAGTYGVANIPNPGEDFTPSTIQRTNSYTAVFTSATTRNYTFQVYKNADEATTWNSYYEVWVSPVSETGSGTNIAWTVPLGTWTLVPSTGMQTICTFRLRQNRTETITFRIEIRNITTRAGPRSPFTTRVWYSVN